MGPLGGTLAGIVERKRVLTNLVLSFALHAVIIDNNKVTGMEYA